MNNGIISSLKYACLCEKARFYHVQEKIRHILTCKNITPEEENWAREFITGLDFFSSYQGLSRVFCLDVLDPRVVSAYWLGDHRPGDYFHNWTTLLPILRLPIERIEVKQVDDCFVHPAVVQEIGDNNLIVAYNPVFKNNDKLELGQTTKREVSIELLTDEINESMFVTIHFGGAIQRINPETYSNLQQLTIDALAKFNAARRAP